MTLYFHEYKKTRTIYVYVEVQTVDEKRLKKQERPITCCMTGYLFVYTDDVIVREYLCDCLQCLKMDLEKFLKTDTKTKETK